MSRPASPPPTNTTTIFNPSSSPPGAPRSPRLTRTGPSASPLLIIPQQLGLLANEGLVKLDRTPPFQLERSRSVSTGTFARGRLPASASALPALALHARSSSIHFPLEPSPGILNPEVIAIEGQGPCYIAATVSEGADDLALASDDQDPNNPAIFRLGGLGEPIVMEHFKGNSSRRKSGSGRERSTSGSGGEGLGGSPVSQTTATTTTTSTSTPGSHHRRDKDKDKGKEAGASSGTRARRVSFDVPSPGTAGQGHHRPRPTSLVGTSGSGSKSGLSGIPVATGTGSTTTPNLSGYNTKAFAAPSGTTSPTSSRHTASSISPVSATGTFRNGSPVGNDRSSSPSPSPSKTPTSSHLRPKSSSRPQQESTTAPTLLQTPTKPSSKKHGRKTGIPSPTSSSASTSTTTPTTPLTLRNGVTSISPGGSTTTTPTSALNISTAIAAPVISVTPVLSTPAAAAQSPASSLSSSPKVSVPQDEVRSPQSPLPTSPSLPGPPKEGIEPKAVPVPVPVPTIPKEEKSSNQNPNVPLSKQTDATPSITSSTQDSERKPGEEADSLKVIAMNLRNRLTNDDSAREREGNGTNGGGSSHSNGKGDGVGNGNGNGNGNGLGIAGEEKRKRTSSEASSIASTNGNGLPASGEPTDATAVDVQKASGGSSTKKLQKKRRLGIPTPTSTSIPAIPVVSVSESVPSALTVAPSDPSIDELVEAGGDARPDGKPTSDISFPTLPVPVEAASSQTSGVQPSAGSLPIQDDETVLPSSVPTGPFHFLPRGSTAELDGGLSSFLSLRIPILRRTIRPPHFAISALDLAGITPSTFGSTSNLVTDSVLAPIRFGANVGEKLPVVGGLVGGVRNRIGSGIRGGGGLSSDNSPLPGPDTQPVTPTRSPALSVDNISGSLLIPVRMGWELGEKLPVVGGLVGNVRSRVGSFSSVLSGKGVEGQDGDLY